MCQFAAFSCLAGCQASPAMRDVAVTKRLSVQQDSNISKLKKNQTLHSLHDLHGEMYSAQRHSKTCKLITMWSGKTC